LGFGTIYKDREFLTYAVRSLKELNKVIAHFEKYSLITQKKADFELFKQIVFIKANNRHLSLENFKKILGLRVNLNSGISEKLKEAFPDIIPILKPFVTLQDIPDPHWLTGFIDGEGCFIINTQD